MDTMLIELTLRNFAVIQETRLSLGPGLHVVTGETGAGKSLLVDALEMALGARTGRDIIRADTAGSTVEAVFQVPAGHPVWHFLAEEYGIVPEEDGLLILAREVQTEGRSLSRLNGRTVPQALLRETGRLLTDIHSQGTQLSLLNPAFQLRLLDTFGDLTDARNQVAEAVASARGLERELAELSTNTREAEQRRDLLAYQVQEIEAAELQAGEEESLVQRHKLLSNVQNIQEACEAARDALSTGSPNAADLLGVARNAIARSPDPTDVLQAQIASLDTTMANVEETVRELRTHAESIDNDPRELEVTEERLDLVRKLIRKYGDTTDAVLTFAQNAQIELEAMEGVDSRRAGLEQANREALDTAESLAWSLSEQRHEAALGLAEAVARELKDVGLERVGFEVAISQQSTLEGLPVPNAQHYAATESGIDQIEFLVATNPGEGLRALAKVASGGETSRLMLAITSALGSDRPGSTLVFDEIDSGIGARASDTVGQKLWALAQHHQVLCISHLPQIAAYADHHFRAGKEVLDQRTFTNIKEIESEERVEELAAMLGGAESLHLDKAARELLHRAQMHKEHVARMTTTRSRPRPVYKGTEAALIKPP